MKQRHRNFPVSAKGEKPSKLAPIHRQSCHDAKTDDERRKLLDSFLEQLGFVPYVPQSPRQPRQPRLGLAQLADLLEVSPRTLYAWRNGELPVPKYALLALRGLLVDRPTGAQ